ncbi:zinc finger and SCAN domain-containing 29-like protein [Labeo rohita]|uniref:Zinc finger and SCAN domain-containing 29-like protein n=1 Tax=Labeo rohita TaxID=84645 RepID=A0A498LLE7_LABRO|nr:uncharacterized protein LOC127176447 [Labeo rohita]RXN07846.1 zinc finger and SCAN domain-containing 29-like protein [Labeo rohita]
MSSSRRSTHFWSEEETDFLLQTLKEMNIDRYRDGRKHRNSLIFRKVCARHKEAGFARSCDQVKHRWKTLKSIYYKAKKQNNGSSNAAFKHFDTMEEIFGHRPLVVMTNQSGADIDLKDGSPLSDSKCFTFEDAEDAEDAEDDDADNGVDDVEGGIQEIQSVKTENEPLILTQASHESSTTSTESSTPTQPFISTHSSTSTQHSTAPGVLKRRRPCCAALHSQYQGFLERLQQSQNAWLERQLEQSHVREERLIARVLAEHTRSMEALVNQLFAGLRSLLPPSHPSADPQTTHTALDVLSTRTGVSTAEQQSSSSGTES